MLSLEVADSFLIYKINFIKIRNGNQGLGALSWDHDYLFRSEFSINFRRYCYTQQSLIFKICNGYRWLLSVADSVNTLEICTAVK